LAKGGGNVPGYRVPWKSQDVLVVFLALIGVSWFFGRINPGLDSNFMIEFFGLAALMQTITIIGLVIYFVRSRYRLSWPDFGLASISVTNIGIGLAGGVLLFFLVAMMAWVMDWFIPQPVEPQLFVEILLAAQNWWQLMIVTVVASVLAPLSEELYFRGFLFPFLRQRIGVDFALWGSAVFFGALHLDLIRFIPLTLGGYGLALIYHRTGSLWASIIAHGVWNTIMTLLVYWLASAGGI
jgi:hypothetical protein